MIIRCPGVGLIMVVRVSDHFAVNSGGDGSAWNVTHIPSGYAAIHELHLCDAVAAALEFQSCGVDWDFAHQVSREYLYKAKPIRDRYLAIGRKAAGR